MMTPKPARKARQVRAKKRWASRVYLKSISDDGAYMALNRVFDDDIPVWLLDLSTPEKFDAAVEQMAKVYACPEDDGYGLAIDALASLGITRPTKKENKA